MMLAESEYETKTSLSEFSKKELAGRFRITVIEGAVWDGLEIPLGDLVSDR